MSEQIQVSAERCLHGLRKQFCGVCTRPDKPMAERIDPGLRFKAGSNPPRDERFFIVHLNDLRRDGYSGNATHVHFVGAPTHPCILRIFEMFPNLEVLNFAPSFVRYGDPHKYVTLFGRRGVRLQFENVTGVEGVSVKYRMGDPRWAALRSRFLRFTQDQKSKLEELVALGFDEGVAFKMYLLIDCGEEDRISLQDVAELLSYKFEGRASDLIGGIFYYLDPSFETNGHARKFGRNLARRVTRKNH